jgi:hypothetical protein
VVPSTPHITWPAFERPEPEKGTTTHINKSRKYR